MGFRNFIFQFIPTSVLSNSSFLTATGFLYFWKSVHEEPSSLSEGVCGRGLGEGPDTEMNGAFLVLQNRLTKSDMFISL